MVHICIWVGHRASVDMMTSSNGNIFRVTGPLCREFTGLGEFPAQRPVTRSFDVFFHLRLNKRLSKLPQGWWFETPPLSLWHQCNEIHSKNKVVKWTTLGLSNWCQKRTPQSRPKLVIWMSRRMTTLMSSQKQPESRQMTTFLLVSLPCDDLVITLERLNDKPQIVKWWSFD